MFTFHIRLNMVCFLQSPIKFSLTKGLQRLELRQELCTRFLVVLREFLLHRMIQRTVEVPGTSLETAPFTKAFSRCSVATLANHAYHSDPYLG